jgi:hypothetical protein
MPNFKKKKEKKAGTVEFTCKIYISGHETNAYITELLHI